MQRKSKHIVIFSLPTHGHINPMLPLAAELVRRGHNVSFYATEEFEKAIKETGSTFVNYDYPEFHRIDLRLAKYGILLADKVIDATWFALDHIQFSKKNKPDIIVHDGIALWGKVFAHKYAIPAVSVATTLLITPKVLIRYPHMDVAIIANFLQHIYGVRKRYKQLLKKEGIKFHGIDDILINEETCTLVLTSHLFQPYVTSFGKHISFVGPLISPRKHDEDIKKILVGKKNIIYISLGTIYNDNIHFFTTCIHALKDTDYTVIISLGTRVSLKDLPAIPENFIVYPSVPQLEILQKAKLFITHGGMNSVMESLYYGVPMVVVPQMTEQRINGLRVDQLGAGICLDKKNLTQTKLLYATDTIRSSKSYYHNAKRIQMSLQEAGGYKKAVDLILQASL